MRRAQTDATLDVVSDTADVSWVDTDGRSRTNNYIIPNSNQCKGCHKLGETITPIGPKARHLNRDFAYSARAGESTRPLDPSGGTRWVHPLPAEVPRLAVWNDPASGTLDARARAWLEINCAHCHNPDGPARNSGLDLLASQRNPTAFGIFKTPVAAGLGSGGRSFDIVPGQPDQSIMAYRIASTHPGVMMPELGKRLVHDEGVALVRHWIAALPDPLARPSSPPRPARVSRHSDVANDYLRVVIESSSRRLSRVPLRERTARAMSAAAAIQPGRRPDLDRGRGPDHRLITSDIPWFDRIPHRVQLLGRLAPAGRSREMRSLGFLVVAVMDQSRQGPYGHRADRRGVVSVLTARARGPDAGATA